MEKGGSPGLIRICSRGCTGMYTTPYEVRGTDSVSERCTAGPGPTFPHTLHIDLNARSTEHGARGRAWCRMAKDSAARSGRTAEQTRGDGRGYGCLESFELRGREVEVGACSCSRCRKSAASLGTRGSIRCGSSVAACSVRRDAPPTV